jgi:hypothetical protein
MIGEDQVCYDATMPTSFANLEMPLTVSITITSMSTMGD